MIVVGSVCILFRLASLYCWTVEMLPCIFCSVTLRFLDLLEGYVMIWTPMVNHVTFMFSSRINLSSIATLHTAPGPNKESKPSQILIRLEKAYVGICSLKKLSQNRTARIFKQPLFSKTCMYLLYYEIVYFS